MLAGLLKRSAERLGVFLESDRIFQNAGGSFSKPLIRIRRSFLLQMSVLVDDATDVLEKKNCIERMDDFRIFMNFDNSPITNAILATKANYESLESLISSISPNLKQPGFASLVMEIGKRVLMCPLPGIVGDRYGIVAVLDRDTPVYRAIDCLTGSQVALKVLHREYNSCQEIAMTRLANSAAPTGTVSLISVETSPPLGRQKTEICMVMELCQSSVHDLRQTIETTSKSGDEPLCSIETLCTIFEQVAETLSILHDNDIIHGDIKPDNIMFVGTKPRLIDFGLSSMVNTKTERQSLYTMGYVPPEFIHRGIGKLIRIEPSMDVFALGMTMLLTALPDMNEVFSRLDKKNYRSGRRKISKALDRMTDSPVHKEFRDLVSKMLEFDPMRRPTASQVWGDMRKMSRELIGASRYPEEAACMRCLETAIDVFQTVPSVADRIRRVSKIDPMGVDLVKTASGKFSMLCASAQYISLVENCGVLPMPSRDPITIDDEESCGTSESSGEDGGWAEDKCADSKETGVSGVSGVSEETTDENEEETEENEEETEENEEETGGSSETDEENEEESEEYEVLSADENEDEN